MTFLASNFSSITKMYYLLISKSLICEYITNLSLFESQMLFIFFVTYYTKYFVNVATLRSTNYVPRREIHRICLPGILPPTSVFLEIHRLKINNMSATCMWKPLTLSTKKLKRLALLFGWLYFGKLFSKPTECLNHFWRSHSFS